MKMCNCLCSICDKVFSKALNEVKRSVNKSRPVFCSRICAGVHASKSEIKLAQSRSPENRARLLANSKANNRADEYSPFRETLRRLYKREKDVSIDLPYLKQLWEAQEGRCAYLGMPLILPLTSGYYDKSNPNLLASLDRIDSDLGYVEGNLQYISMTLNFAKNQYKEKVLLDLFALIKASPKLTD